MRVYNWKRHAVKCRSPQRSSVVCSLYTWVSTVETQRMRKWQLWHSDFDSIFYLSTGHVMINSQCRSILSKKRALTSSVKFKNKTLYYMEISFCLCIYYNIWHHRYSHRYKRQSNLCFFLSKIVAKLVHFLKPVFCLSGSGVVCGLRFFSQQVVQV